jgi:hypothetical protein
MNKCMNYYLVIITFVGLYVPQSLLFVKSQENERKHFPRSTTAVPGIEKGLDKEGGSVHTTLWRVFTRIIPK